MRGGRPRTSIGTFGEIYVMRRGARCVAETRYRDVDGRLRKVTATAGSAKMATALLKQRIADRPGHAVGNLLDPSSSFSKLVTLWLADLDLRDLADGTKDSYRDLVRLHVLPAFEHFTLGEVTTGRVEWFLKGQAAISESRARHSRTMLNLLFAFALRHDAIARNPVEGTSPLKRSKTSPRALTLDQVAAIRAAAAAWRNEPGLPGPKSDGQVRDIIEVLLGTAMRPGEVLGLRICDVEDRPDGMVAHVRGTVVQRSGKGVFRQDRPKSDASIRTVPVPPFAAEVLRRRLGQVEGDDRDRTIFANRSGGPLSPNNVRRTFRDFLTLAGLEDSGISLRWYRTSTHEDQPVGFTCQSFFSVSTDPPLVSFSVMRTSTTYPKIARAGRFCVNVLAQDQHRISSQFAMSGTDKWAGVAWSPSPSGNPVIEDTLLWVDCETWAEHEAGDHLIVVGRVVELSPPDRARSPLLYFRGGYCHLGAHDQVS